MHERARPVLVAVVEEVLLELIEEDVCLLGPARFVEEPLDRLRPGVPDRDDRARPERAQLPHDSCGEERGLADPALAVENGEPRRDEIRDDDVTLALAAEEEEPIELRVLEGGQALERRKPCRDRCAQT